MDSNQILDFSKTIVIYFDRSKFRIPDAVNQAEINKAQKRQDELFATFQKQSKRTSELIRLFMNNNFLRIS